MNIKQVSMGLIGATVLTGIFSSCAETKYEDKAKAQAVKYLNGDQLLKAERFAAQQTNYDSENGDAIIYWDSLLTEAKVKEAYAKGQQLVRDRANKIFNREEKFPVPLDTVFRTNVIDESINEYAKYSAAEDFIKARNNAPDKSCATFHNNRAASAHYWNLITIAAKQREAYEQGIADESAKMKAAEVEKTPKVKTEDNPIVKTAIEALNSNITREAIETDARSKAYQSINK